MTLENENINLNIQVMKKLEIAQTPQWTIINIIFFYFDCLLYFVYFITNLTHLFYKKRSLHILLNINFISLFF